MEDRACPGEMKIPNQKLRQERERRFWTHADVARYINLLPDFGSTETDSALVEHWECGLTPPGPRYCQALCTIFQMDAQALGLFPAPANARYRGVLTPTRDSYQTVAYDEEQNFGTLWAALNQQPQNSGFTHAPTHIDNTVFRNIKQSLPQERNNRQHLLRRVRRFWITDVLEHSLHHAALIELGFQTRPDALVNPWHLLQESAQAKRTLPPKTAIIQVYDEADGALLILGEPGAGKTTLLLDLTRHLLNRAEQDETQLIPVVFNLSSWAIKRMPMREWLVEELHDKYQVPRKIGQNWIDNERILLLLDGLDEVTSFYRMSCIEAINAFRQKYGMVPVVVCSRSAEYHTLSTQLNLQMAVVIQPLSLQQIERYLQQVGKPLEALRMALQHDLALQELATTPLMLSVLTLAYHGLPLDEILENSTLEAKRQQIFATYVQRMLTRRGSSTHHSPAKTVQWLAYLARQMKHQNQSVFYIEHIQPDWLEDVPFHRLYDRLAIQLIGICVGALISLVVSLLFLGTMTITVRAIYEIMGALLGALLSGRSIEPLPERKHPQHHNRNKIRLLLHNSPLRNGLGVALMILCTPGGSTWHAPLKGIIISSTFGLISALLSLLLVPDATNNRQYRTGTILKQGALIGVLIGLSTGLSFTLTIGPVVGIGFGLIVGISFALIALLLLLFFSQRSQTIQLAEIISWSPQGLWHGLVSTRYLKQGALVAGLVGLGVGLSNALIFGPSVTLTKILSIQLNKIPTIGNNIDLLYRAIVGLGFGLTTGISLGLSYCFILGLLHGLSNHKLEEHHRMTPNQGIGRSARNGLIVGTICAWVSWLIQVAMLFLFTHSYDLFSLQFSTLVEQGSDTQIPLLLHQGLDEVLFLGLHNALFIGPSCGLLVGLLIGGWACIQHTVLRLLLWRSGAMPWNYSHFLDFATERILLRKVGGGYIFVHRLLLDYFASLLPRQKAETPQLPTIQDYPR
ncbi:NACHT domain-containing protein [Dictyobacter arantiisoli]|uniref:NACHT domain-containing protein n=1 Tax=Dictyobacter arantiisoli TaxID=2014874 RepID=A0A5A5TBK0_9CHLR|nr:NACHT domain-containing protein [Dictyobacter arantiisoli]GCF08737.1 hypothetical protein KDI_23010 [Dictyobacter arantiisoli]